MCRLSYQGWTTARVICGEYLRTAATVTIASPGHCCKNFLLNKEVRSITPILCELNWPPAELHIDYKILSLVDSCMNGTVPKYLQELQEPRGGELRTQKLKSPLLRTQSSKVLPLKPGVDQYLSLIHI